MRILDSPLGKLALAADEGGALLYLGFRDAEPRRGLLERLGPASEDPRHYAAAERQLEAYFQGSLRTFDLPLCPRGTPFQLRVWGELARIPYGSTATYGELAMRLGSPHLSRAVGAANGANPISIIIPCHRLLGAGGALTGYAGGLRLKRALLDLEAGSSPGTRSPLEA